MSGWTPGPWTISRFKSEGTMVMGDKHAVTVADCGLSAVVTDDAKIANARLIAAAPDLYEALSELQQHVIRHACVWDEASNGTHHHPVWAKVSAALQRATEAS